MSVSSGIGTEKNSEEISSSIKWEKIGGIAIPFIRKTNGHLLTSKHLLKDVIFKQEFKILKDEMFELACSPHLPRYSATKLENRLLNEISNEMLNISLGDRPIFLVILADAMQLYTVLHDFHTVITERKLSNPLFGYVFIEHSQTPVPFLSVKNVGVVVPTCFFECPQLMPVMFSLTNHWDFVYLKCLFKLLGIRKTFYDNPKVVRLKTIFSHYPACRSYSVAHTLPPIAQVSAITVYDDDIIIVENQQEAIEISSSDDESSGPQQPKRAKLKFADNKSEFPEVKKDEQVDTGTSTMDTIEKDKQPQASNSTNHQHLVHKDPVEILDIIPNKDLSDQEYSKLRDNPDDDSDLGFHKVYKIIPRDTPTTYDVGIQRFKDIKYEFICISTKQDSPKKVYLINLSEILEVMFPRVEVRCFMSNCNKFSLKIFALDASHIEFLTTYYKLKKREPPKDYFYLELRKFCDVFWTLKRLVEE